VYTPDVLKYTPSRYYPIIKCSTYEFCEGTVTLTEEHSEWVEMSLFKDKYTADYPSYFADGGRYKFSQDYLVRYYE
jgi:hypothetical protein